MRPRIIAFVSALCAGCASLPDLPTASSSEYEERITRSGDGDGGDGGDGGARLGFAAFTGAASALDAPSTPSTPGTPGTPLAVGARTASAQATARALPPSPLVERAASIAAGLAPGESAHWLLDRNAFALDARLALVDTATRTLDVQYFIWQGDATGTLLAKRLLAAADRGVEIRLLLDDFGVISKPSELVALEAHERISVRTFNPWAARGLRAAKAAEYLRRAALLNRRMHNKTLTADGVFAMVGGRNIGDRYFGVYEPFVQNDLDLLAAGPLAGEIAASFELYWRSDYSYPVALLRPEGFAPLAETRRVLDAVLHERRRALSSFPLEPTEWHGFFARLSQTPLVGRSELYLDSPAIEEDRSRIYDRLKALMSGAQEEVLVSSPYFVPDEELMEVIRGLTSRGVRVAIVTNSLATNNHVVAHTGYRHWRREVLEAQAELYELRADAAVLELYRTEPVVAASVGLHTKAVVIDGRTTFIGSPNIDPRSMIHNTEVAAVTQSAALGRELRALIARDMQPANAWRVTLDGDGWLTWSSGDEELYRQPARGFGQRMIEFFLNLLPLKNQI